MTRDEAIDRVLIELGVKPLLCRLMASVPPEQPADWGKVTAADKEAQGDYRAATRALNLAGRIVDKLPLSMPPVLTPEQEHWLADYSEFEPCLPPRPDVAYADMGVLYGNGCHDSLPDYKGSINSILVGIPRLPDRAGSKA